MPNARRNYTTNKSNSELIGDIGFGEKVKIDLNTKKKILITGAGSYIGESFRKYAQKHYFENFSMDTIDVQGDAWKEKSFSGYDLVYHVAGIAHADVGNVDEQIKEKYYMVNTDLTVDICKKAKREGVKEFIFMSSMIVYGESAPYGKKRVVNKETVPKAANFYGDSKLQADVAVREMADDQFKVIVIRPPMIYGKGSKGNYPLLSKLSKKLPFFPMTKNERSMLYVENLCEFLCQIILIHSYHKNEVVLIPQNSEWTDTANMVKQIAAVSGKNIRLLKVLSPAVYLGSKVPGKIGGLINKAFGNNVYDLQLSNYPGVEYQKYTLVESIKATEGKNE